jgi:hypothetical protein
MVRCLMKHNEVFTSGRSALLLAPSIRHNFTGTSKFVYYTECAVYSVLKTSTNKALPVVPASTQAQKTEASLAEIWHNLKCTSWFCHKLQQA